MSDRDLLVARYIRLHEIVANASYSYEAIEGMRYALGRALGMSPLQLPHTKLALLDLGRDAISILSYDPNAKLVLRGGCRVEAAPAPPYSAAVTTL